MPDRCGSGGILPLSLEVLIETDVEVEEVLCCFLGGSFGAGTDEGAVSVVAAEVALVLSLML